MRYTFSPPQVEALMAIADSPGATRLHLGLHRGTWRSLVGDGLIVVGDKGAAILTPDGVDAVARIRADMLKNSPTINGGK